MIVARIPCEKGQKLISYLQEHDLFDKRYKSLKKNDFLHFVVRERFELFDVDFVDMDESEFETATVHVTLKDALAGKLSDAELAKLKTAFDSVGTIAILEIDTELRHVEKVIGETLLAINPQLNTVLRKDGEHQGEFRTQPMKLLAGVDTRVAELVENGVKMRVNVETVYFSPRLSNERMRIAQQVKSGEDVLILFSGAAPQGVIIGKHSPANHIDCVEINPEGHKYALENIALNKLTNVTAICGDAHTVVPDKKYDRITMNLPKTAFEFLDDALSHAKESCVLHYYDFLHDEEFDIAKKRVSEACERAGFSYEFLGIHTVGSQGVRTYRICLDVQIFKLAK